MNTKDNEHRERSAASDAATEQNPPLFDSCFRALVEQSPISTQILSPDGKTIFVNKAWEKLWGINLDALIDYNILKDNQLKELGLMPYVVRAFAGETVEAPLVQYDVAKTMSVKEPGEKRWVRAFVFPIKDAQGEVCQVIIKHEDVTQEKEELLGSEERYRGIFDESVAAIFVFDENKNFIDSNQAGLDLLGYSREELMKMSIPDVDADHEAVIPALKKVMSGERIINFEHNLIRKDGRMITVLNNSKPLTSTNGDIIGMQSTLIDITERKQSESEQARLQRELQQAQKMEILGHLTGGIAHDFNNLLTVITGFIYLSLKISKDVGNTKLVENLEKINTATQKATNLVAQMLSFGRMNPADSSPIQIEALLKDEIAMLRATLPSTIELDVNIEENLPPILMNPTQLQQMVLNLSVNARDAMDSEGKLGIHLGLMKNLNTVSPVSHKTIKGDWVALTVTDTGSGITPEILDKIFIPFFTTKQSGKGTGMGLAIVYRIIETHGGDILIDSSLGQGTRLTLLFPPLWDKAFSNTCFAAAKNGNASGRGENILIVDDEESVVALMDEMLKNFGYAPTTTTDSTEALELIKTHPGKFSLLITDQTMPKLSGIQLIRKIREIDSTLPVALCTGYSDKIDKEKAQAEGIHYFSKPVDFDTLRKKLAIILKHPDQ